MFRVIAAAMTASVLSLALVAGGAVAAHADDEPPPPRSRPRAIQRAGALQTDRRITGLENAANRLEHSEYVGDDTRERLTTIIDDGIADMTTTQAADRGGDHRIRGLGRVPRHVHRVPHLRGRAAAGLRRRGGRPARGHDGAAAAGGSRPAGRRARRRCDSASDAAAQKLDELQALLDEANGNLDGLADRALAVTPADFDADHTVLTSIRAELRGRGSTLRGAAALAREILAAAR